MSQILVEEMVFCSIPLRVHGKVVILRCRSERECLSGKRRQRVQSCRLTRVSDYMTGRTIRPWTVQTKVRYCETWSVNTTVGREMPDSKPFITPTVLYLYHFIPRVDAPKIVCIEQRGKAKPHPGRAGRVRPTWGRGARLVR